MKKGVKSMSWHHVTCSRVEEGGPESSPQCDFCSRYDLCNLEVKMNIESSRMVMEVCLSSMLKEQVSNTEVESCSKLSGCPFPFYCSARKWVGTDVRWNLGGETIMFCLCIKERSSLEWRPREIFTALGGPVWVSSWAGSLADVTRNPPGLF